MGEDDMLIDCNRCALRGVACADCVVTVFLALPRARGARGPGPGSGPGLGSALGRGIDGAVDAGTARVVLDDSERAAVAALAAAGLVPPLRLVAGVTADIPDSA